MSEILGSMGKGGGGATPVEAKDNLISTQTIKTVFAVSEGYIDGFSTATGTTDGVYLDDVPISNFDAEVQVQPGSQSQAPLVGFETVESPHPTFTPSALTRGAINWAEMTAPGFTPNYKYITIANDVNRVRITMLINRLQQLDGANNVVGAAVYYDVAWTPGTPVVGSTYTSIFPIITVPYKNHPTNRTAAFKKGKTTNGYAFDIEVERPTGLAVGSNWGVRVERVSTDDSSQKKSRVTTLQAVTEIRDQERGYDNTALVAVVLNDAKQFGNRIPEITFKSKGIRVSVPNNYNPTTRVYTGNWTAYNFGVSKQYTNNPAWCLYDVLTNDRYGLGVAAADVDVYALYALGQYADDMIPNGYGTGNIPRYTLDYQFNDRGSPQTLLSQILSICNASLTINEFGQLSVIYLHAGQSVTRNVTCQNVIDGIFTYSSSDIEQRSNLVNVTYNNGLYFGRTDTVTVTDNTLVTRYGLQTSDIVLAGCYNQAQAIRKARSVLYINSYFTELITFSVLFEGLTYKIGDIIRIFDDYNPKSTNELTSGSQSGVITAVTAAANTTLTFDRSITVPSGTNTFYTFANGVEISTTITGPTTISSVVVTGTPTIVAGQSFIIKNPSAGLLYRVVKIIKEDDTYAISALQYSEDLFTYIEQGISIPAKPIDNMSNLGIIPPTGLSVSENFSTNGSVRSSSLTFSWAWTDTAGAKAYFKVIWNKDSTTDHTVELLSVNEFTLYNVDPGTYTFTVYAINPFTGLQSLPSSISYDFKLNAGTGANASDLLPPTNVRVTGQTATSPLIFDTPDVSISFDYPWENSNSTDALADYVIQVWHVTDDTSTGLKGSFVTAPIVGSPLHYSISFDPSGELTYIPLNGLFYLSLEQNIALFGTATRNFRFKIYSRDVTGDLSAPVTVTINNPVPAMVAWNVTATFNGVNIDLTESTEADVTEYLLYASTTNNFTKDATTLKWAGKLKSFFVSMPTDVQYYYALGVADSFGRTGINISSEQFATAYSATVDSYTYTGLLFKPNDGATNKISWTSFIATKNGTTSVTVAAGNATWTTGIMYLYYVPGNTTLQTSTNLVTAVSGRILASYRGGTDLTSDQGRAYIDGDTLIAGTVGANQLVTNTAIITSSAQVGADIQSANYNASTHTGWIIQQNGYASFTNVNIYNQYGELILSSGQQVQGATFGGRSFTAGTLTLVGTANISGNSINKI